MNDFQLALAAYLARDDSAECDLAAAVGRSQAAINRYRNGKRFPDAETARAIETRTDGEVPFSAWQADFLARSGLAPDVAMPAPAQASDTACVDEGRQVLCVLADAARLVADGNEFLDDGILNHTERAKLADRAMALLPGIQALADTGAR